jgi:hypothetical protein
MDKLNALKNRINKTPMYGWSTHRQLLEDIVDHFKEHETYTDSIPCAPDTTKFRATRSGFIKLERKHVHRGGYYGFNRYIPYAVLVGGNVDSGISSQIEELVKMVCERSKELVVTNSDDTTQKGHFHSSHGTNYSTYGWAF